MECPYCPEQVIGMDELSVHIMKVHPEKTYAKVAEYFSKSTSEAKLSRIWDTAEKLVEATLFQMPRAKSSKPEELLKLFKYFLRELMQSE